MDELKYFRITEVLKPFTGIEFVDEKILKFAADRGSYIHGIIEGILKGFDFQIYEEETSNYIQSFNEFWQGYQHNFKDGEFILENRLYCKENLITGQPDLMVVNKNRTYIVDWKTSSKHYKYWHLQGAAYRYLAEKNGYKNVDNVLFVKLNKTGKKASLYKEENHEYNLNIFMKCLDLYKYFEMDKTRKKV